MLANFSNSTVRSGTLNKDVHLPATSRHALLDFIAAELPSWRDRPDRKKQTSETVLTSQLTAHLNSAARKSIGWDFLQFRVEEPDELQTGRKIDLVPAPCGSTVWIDGRRHTDFDALLPIECKRLPTPSGRKRDPREYVFNKHGSTGGIQRFKEGNHGPAHEFGAMIAYVQEDKTFSAWNKQVSNWINGLTHSGASDWSNADALTLISEDQAQKVAQFRSNHNRRKGLTDIEIRHIWIAMN